ncbi:MAG: exodeoxyribonuclease VII small subunit [Planctomycetes bacterium]|nr:exodeoxyribonuclease VII small subunit [Planctomycetota bacterium]
MPKEQRFEDYQKVVEDVVHKLESGELGLEESLEQYEKGIGAIKKCYEILNSCEEKIKVLVTERNKIIEQKDFKIK